MSILRSAITISLFTLCSRILGYIRDILIATIIGVGPVAEAYVVAFRLPNFFRNLVAEGAFASSFIPILSSLQEDKAIKFIGNTVILMTIITLPIVLITEAFMPMVIKALTPGFDTEIETYNLAVEFSTITMPYLFFISLIAVYVGTLNRHKHFIPGAIVPIILNFSMITCLLLFKNMTKSAGHSLVIGISVAGIIQLAYVIWACKSYKLKIQYSFPKLTPEIKNFAKKIVPGILGTMGTQINTLISTFMASFIPGGLAILYFADRIIQLPISLFGYAIGSALLPSLTEHMNKDLDKAYKIQQHFIILGLLISIPASFALITLAFPIIDLLFVHGHFTLEDGFKTSYTVQAYAIGLPAYMLLKIITPCFFAKGDTQTPAKWTIISVIANLLFNIILIKFLAQVGIALSSSISAWLNIAVITYILYKRQWLKIDKNTIYQIGKLIISATIMVIVIIATLQFLDFTDNSTFYKMLKLGLLIITGIGTYFISVLAFKILTISELKALIRHT